jgi:phosphatidyl-myo-inositol dimannoside synthase
MKSRASIVLTPGILGDDGLALFSREVVSALRYLEPDAGVEVWSLTDRTVNGSRIRSAGGDRLRYGWWGLAEGVRAQAGRRIVSLHTHLLPVVLPLVHRGAHLVHFVVGVDAWKPLSRLQTAALRRATQLVAISRHSATEFRRANPWYEGPEILICHPGLPDVADVSESAGGAYALIVGRMSSEERYKGHDLLLDIWGDVRTRHAGAELLIVGGGDDRARLDEKAKQLGLGEAVRFLGKVSPEDLDRLYRECAFFVMPSRHEGFGLVFLEAMRAGKACIGARGAASEIIEDGVTGFVVDPNDPGAVTSAIDKLWSDQMARERMGTTGRRRFQEHFTRERFQDRLRGLITK